MKVRQVVSLRRVIHRCVMLAVLGGLAPARLFAGEPLGPEATLRVIVEANAARDLATMSKYMSHDADAVGYTIDGHKYVGWSALEADMRSEFEAVHKLELPIMYLQVWPKGDLALFAMNWTTYGTPGTRRVISGWSCRSEKHACSNGETASGSSSPGMNPCDKRIPASARAFHSRGRCVIAPLRSLTRRPVMSA